MFIGFGSLVINNPEKLTSRFIKALKEAGLRGILQVGHFGHQHMSFGVVMSEQLKLNRSLLHNATGIRGTQKLRDGAFYNNHVLVF